MEQVIRVAIQYELARIFAGRTQFVQRLPNPIIVTPDHIRSTLQSIETARELSALIEWWRLLNPIPGSNQIVEIRDWFLWDAFNRVLRSEVRFPKETMTRAEETATANALKVLFVHDDNFGLRRYTIEYQKYKQFEHDYDLLGAKYRSLKQLALSSNDPLKIQKWTKVDGPKLEGELLKIDSEWRSLGSKETVEESLAIIANLAHKSAKLKWVEWKQRLGIEFDIVKGVNLLSAMPTAIFPSNFAQNPSWVNATIAADQIQYVEEEMGPGSQTELSEIRFKCLAVGIQRPWFDRTFGQSRFWKFRDSNRVLSDGNKPPNGEFSGYANAILFVKDIETNSYEYPGDSEWDDGWDPDGNSTGEHGTNSEHTDEYGGNQNPKDSGEKRNEPWWVHECDPYDGYPCPGDETEPPEEWDNEFLEKFNNSYGKFIEAERIASSSADLNAFNNLYTELYREYFEGRNGDNLGRDNESREEFLAFGYLFEGFPELPNPDPDLEWDD